MLIHSIIPSSRVNGPGNRTVVWFQGCKLACPGCWNRDTWPVTGLGEYYSASRLAQRIMFLWSVHNTSGVTFSGGEPMHQARELAKVIELVRSMIPGFSFGMYTGYTKGELEDGDFWWKTQLRGRKAEDDQREARMLAWDKISGYLDFAVMGRFNQNLLDASRPMCSSRNQKLVLFGGRYEMEDFAPQQMEAIVSDDFVQITGFPSGDMQHA